MALELGGKGLRVLGICGSPRSGNTELMVKAALEGAESGGAETEFLPLGRMGIKMCGGCGTCAQTKKCRVNDDMQKVYPKIFSADAVVLGTPNYFNNMSGLLKNFIDRLNPYWDDKRLKNKLAVLLCAGGQGEESRGECMRAMRAFCRIEGWKVVAEVSAQAEGKGSVSAHDLRKCREAGASLK